MVNLAPPVGVVNLAPTVGVVNLTSLVGLVILAQLVSVVNLAPPVGVQGGRVSLWPHQLVWCVWQSSLQELGNGKFVDEPRALNHNRSISTPQNRHQH